jgi:hypothetical protein
MTTLKLIPLLLLVAVSCSTQNDKIQNNSQQSIIDSSKIIATIGVRINDADTLVVDKRAAVFYSPDSIQIAKRKKEIGEENFYIGADDYLNFLHTANDFLDSIKLTILNAKDKKYLKFIRSDKSKQIVKLDTLSELWGIYLFDPNKQERLVDMTMIDQEYTSYFK